MIIMASGSEVQLAVKARELLQAEGVGTGWYRSPRIRQPGTRNHSQELQMITDLSSQGARYAQIHPAFVDAFAFLNSTEPADLPAGSYDKGSFIAVVIETDGKGIQGAPLEYHQRKIDIHVTLTGHDSIGWCSKAQCATPAGPLTPTMTSGSSKTNPNCGSLFLQVVSPSSSPRNDTPHSEAKDWFGRLSSKLSTCSPKTRR